MKRKNPLIQAWCGAVVLAFTTAAPAATVFFDFSGDPATNGLLNFYGSANWQPANGCGPGDPSTNGYLQITPAMDSQRGSIVFADFDSGSVVQAFTFEADLRIGNDSHAGGNPADGFSVNYCRANDPVLGVTPPEGWNAGPNCEDNLPEEGTKTGIAIGFDAWNSGGTPPYCNGLNQPDPSYIGPDIVGIDVHVDALTIAQFAMPTLNGACNDATSLQTGPQDPTNPGVSPTNLCWAHLKVVLTTNAQLSIYWKGTQLLSNYQTSYFPSPGRLVFAGRTGNANEFHEIDNIAITTVPASIGLVGAASGFPDGFAIVVNDSGSSVVNTNIAPTLTLNSVPKTPTAITKVGGATTYTYHGFPALLPAGSTNSVFLSCKDGNNNTISGTRTFVVPQYAALSIAGLTAGVDTTKPGFRIQPWQTSAGEPNAVYWMLEQQEGLHGANNADLTAATDNGYIDFTNGYTANVTGIGTWTWTNGYINFDINGPFNAMGGDGDFVSANGYGDSPFPGIPGVNGITDNSSEDMEFFLSIPSPGIYYFGVNSDDGFVVMAGPNPRDRFSQVLGFFNGGRGASDTIFPVAVTNAGVYRMRLAHENGGGGDNCEFFSIASSGAKVLVNDPDPTNTTGIAAYYIGSGAPAYVSQINPYNGATGARPDVLLVQITDGTTTLNAGSVGLKLDGSPRTILSSSKVGIVTTITGADGSHLMSGGPHTATLLWSDSGGANHSNNWSFTVGGAITLDASLRSPLSAADLTRPGFVLHVVQVDPCLPSVINPITPSDCGDGTDNSMDCANGILAGLYFPWFGTNAANVSTAATNNIWFWTNAMDFNIVTSPGDFPLDYPMPGIPTIDGVATRPTDSFVCGFDSYVAFPSAGYYILGVNSDDGFRLNEGWGVTRQVLHVTGTNVSMDVAATVTTSNNVGNPWNNYLPTTPLTAPIVYVDTSQCPGPTTMNLSGAIALIDGNRCNGDGNDGNYNSLVAMCQAQGALACIVQASPGWGTPERMGGGSVNITIPAIHIIGYNGLKDWFHTNGPLTATIQADTHLKLGEADYGKGMSHIDFPVIVPMPGLYPLHLVYEEGGGGCGMEFSVVTPSGAAFDGTRVLMNDNSNPNSLLSYRALTTPARFVSESVVNGILNLTWVGAGALQSATTLSPPNWADVNPPPYGDTYSGPATGPAKFFRIHAISGVMDPSGGTGH